MKRLFTIVIFTLIALIGYSQDVVNVGTSPNDGTGDNLRNAFIKVNARFAADLVKRAAIDDSVTSLRSASNLNYSFIASLFDSTASHTDTLEIFRGLLNAYLDSLANHNDTLVVYRGLLNAYLDSLTVHRDSIDAYRGDIDAIDDSVTVFRDSIDAYSDSISAHTDTLEVFRSEIQENNAKLINIDSITISTSDSLFQMYKGSTRLKNVSEYNVHNILDYGAIADGTTSIATAFQTAIDSAYNNVVISGDYYTGYAGKVVVPPGTYYLDTCIYLPSYLEIEMSQASIFRFPVGYDGCVFTNSLPGRCRDNWVHGGIFILPTGVTANFVEFDSGDLTSDYTQYNSFTDLVVRNAKYAFLMNDTGSGGSNTSQRFHNLQIDGGKRHSNLMEQDLVLFLLISHIKPDQLLILFFTLERVIYL